MTPALLVIAAAIIGLAIALYIGAGHEESRTDRIIREMNDGPRSPFPWPLVGVVIVLAGIAALVWSGYQ